MELPIDIVIVAPTPPDGRGDVAAHVVIIQQPLPEVYTVVLSVIDLWSDPWDPRLVCDLLPADADVTQLTNAAGVLTQCPPFAPGTTCSIWFGDQRVVDDIGRHLHHGVSLHVVVELAHIPSSTAMSHPVHDSDSGEGISLLQTKVAAVQKYLTTLLTVQSDTFTPSDKNVSLDNTADRCDQPQVLSLDDLIPQSVTVVRTPCHKIEFFANQLLMMDIGPVQPFASVVNWHQHTQFARQYCRDWNGALPRRIWFYTDGASSYDPIDETRKASASAVLIVETDWGCQFGGFRACHVPMPATAPLAEHAALHVAISIVCLDGAFSCLNGVPGPMECVTSQLSLPSTVLLQAERHRAPGSVSTMPLCIDVLAHFNNGYRAVSAAPLSLSTCLVIAVIRGMKLLMPSVGQLCMVGFQDLTLMAFVRLSWLLLMMWWSGCGFGNELVMVQLAILAFKRVRSASPLNTEMSQRRMHQLTL
jgi:hypothetical protein